MIYFVIDQRSNAIKIGFSSKPQERLEALQISNPNPLFILGVIEGDEEAEKNLHIRFNRFRLNGEWFEATSELMWFVRRATWGMEEVKEPYRRRVAGDAAVEWLTIRFRERREWKSEELRLLGRDHGLSVHQLFKSVAVQSLPIERKPRIDDQGNHYWIWRARDGWPKATVGTNHESNGQ